MKIIVKNDVGKRLDQFLVEQKIEELFSRSYIDKLVKEHHILVNNEIVKKSFKLQSNDVITIEIPPKKEQKIEPEDIPLEILFEDDFLAIINKQAGLVVHPAAGKSSGTLVNALKFKLDKLSEGGHNLRPGIVHRLDKDTTGAIIVAKDDRTHSLLSRMFQEKKIEKTYHAIVVSEPKNEEATIETFIDRSKADRKKMAVSNSGKKAITHYKILNNYDLFCHLEINLETGRTHQIRVHFSHCNCPILGDETYSNLKRTLNNIPNHYHKKVKYLLANHLKRQALHAFRLKFTHPITGALIDVTAPIPKDMQYALDWLENLFGDVIE